jgi:prepilin-type N-terminal cleavage/methylation domain-containing protein
LPREDGFGLVELLIAMTLLSVALLALIAGFSSSMLALHRAGHSSTATAMAETQLELYRSLRFVCIRLEPSSIPDTSPYTTDPAYSDDQVTTVAVTGLCPNTGVPDEWNASRPVTGTTTPASPDGFSYRVDTYVTWTCPSGTLSGTSDAPVCLPIAGEPLARPVKQVTVVVRDLDTPTKVYSRQASTFDASTGV